MSDQSLQRIEPMPVAPSVEIPPPSLFGTADPVEVVARAGRVATALKGVIRSQGLISKISGKEYPRCEAWTLLGTMLGVFPVLEWTRPVEGGWEARVEARTRDGSVVGAAEAQCLKSERNWSNRDDFALRSMAQTRATAKALRMPLGFVMTLCEIEPTPAEEMTFEPDPRQPSTAKGADRAKTPSARPAPPAPQLPEATEEQRQKWLSMLKPLGQAALDYAYEQGWLLPPAQDFPGEPIEAIALKDVPRGKRQASEILAEIQARIDGDGDLGPQKPQEGSGGMPADTASELENAPEGQMRSKDGHSEPSGPDSDNSVETITGKLEAVSVKEGTSKKGKWVRYGLKIGDLWLSTFDKNLGKCAEQDKNHAVRVQFRRHEKGCDLISIERAQKTS